MCERKLIPNLRLRPPSSARVAIRPRGVWGIMPHSIMDHAFRSVLAATVQGTPARKFSGFHPVHICGVIVRADVGIVDRIVGGEGACVPAERAVAAFVEAALDLAQQPQHDALAGLRSESRYARNAARTFGGWPRARRRASANGRSHSMVRRMAQRRAARPRAKPERYSLPQRCRAGSGFWAFLGPS